ncbi:hypothetical protein ACIQ34_09430 [Ureibacillus sp. NPDC094379]
MAYINNCYICKEDFEVDEFRRHDPKNSRFALYCSRKCRGIAQSRKAAERKKNEPPKVYINNCIQCGKDFEVYEKKQHNPKDIKHYRKCCSPECVAKLRSVNTKRNFELGVYQDQGERIKETYEKKRIERTGLTLDEVIEQYVELGISINELAIKTGYTREMISTELDKRGISKDNHTREIDEKINLAIAEYTSNTDITLQALEDKHGVTRVTLSKHLKQQSIEIRDPLQKYSYNDDYFESIDTEEKAYWLGFLAADGGINEGKTYKSIELGLAEIDKDHLEKFVAAIEGENKMIKHKVNKIKEKEYPSVRVIVNCTKMANDLIDKGITPRKSYTIAFPTFLPKKLIGPYMRGYFDGDGGVQVRNESTIAINIVGNESYILDYMKKIDELLQIPVRKMYSDAKRSSNIKTIYYYGQDARTILDFFYKGATVYLSRKRDKFYTALEIFEAKNNGTSVQLQLF